METLNYPNVQETLYREILDNGLEVIVLPKEGFHKTYATFSTKYGSIDNKFAVGGESPVKVPDGIAHFLEHKMFEEPTGDIFAVFASQGASANAYTSFDRTVYLFSATEQINANLETLINFVQNPYFTDTNVDKEKGIIEQEINMYRDNADWRVYFGLIDALYHNHPVHIDIAGTVESIYQIDKETLYRCYETFYHPSNMLLFVVGGVKADEVFELVRANQTSKTFKPQGDIQRFFDEEPSSVKIPRKVSELPVSLPKVMIGFKEKEVGLEGEALLRQEVETKLMLEALIGPSSKLYQSLYEQDLISDSFGHEFNSSSGYSFSVIGGDTPKPDELIAQIKAVVEAMLKTGIEPAAFERSKRKKIGGYLRMLNSPEAIAGEFTRYRFRDSDMFDVLAFYESCTLEQINARLIEHFDFNQMSVSIVQSPAE
ncbi:EF-P 5-aminopentanol modification-associated protein YfmH [Paenibacillus harenae]|uniref:EF-P 5-aminopentanol modification-associated protein YfmH n=1 Tax=Paenibacillus harenae TaxID=306543 RepID=UPI0027924717|nr:pitrilysin family protein [Paenibacillus harenae]MDQ0059727.1 putative Zn-dependent peptidase [Paenibacillus harenae]